MPSNAKAEAEIIVQYLVGTSASQRLNASYRYALENITVVFLKKEKQLWDSCMEHPWMLPYVDAWLGFRRPDHPLRKKIFIMLGLLETEPEYSDYFLPSRYTFSRSVTLGFTCVLSLIKIITGRIITWIV